MTTAHQVMPLPKLGGGAKLLLEPVAGEYRRRGW
jgi:hypothetical protein